MLTCVILNPGVNSLVSRVRHTNTLITADRGFPFWQSLNRLSNSRAGSQGDWPDSHRRHNPIWKHHDRVSLTRQNLAEDELQNTALPEIRNRSDPLKTARPEIGTAVSAYHTRYSPIETGRGTLRSL
jgi:hypothetical protein